MHWNGADAADAGYPGRGVCDCIADWCDADACIHERRGGDPDGADWNLTPLLITTKDFGCVLWGAMP
jgi:hypothetical protein